MNVCSLEHGPTRDAFLDYQKMQKNRCTAYKNGDDLLHACS